MKPSRYNFFFQVDDRAILGYNSLTTALAELSAQEFATLQEFCDEPRDDLLDACGPGSVTISSRTVSWFPTIAKNSNSSERSTTALKMQRQRSIGLTIVPTLDCNFRCAYCFSYARPERMSARGSGGGSCGSSRQSLRRTAACR